MLRVKPTVIAMIVSSLFLTSLALADAVDTRDPKRQRVDREQLLSRAFRSTGFLMMMAGADQGFLKGLTPNELKLHSHIASISFLTELRQWLLEQKAHNFKHGQEDAFVFVMAEGEEGVKMTLNTKATLVFSDDSKLFRLRPDQPERTAVTSSDPRDEIFVNRTKISQPDFKITFPEAVGLAVHEYGNKTGDQRDQSSIDSLAAKVQGFVERHTRVFETEAGRLSLTSFPNAPFEDLVQFSLSRTMEGGLARLWLSGDQGFYAFLENATGSRDLTKELTGSLRRASFRSPPKSREFDWLDFQWYLARDPKVNEAPNGKLQIEISLHHWSAFIPFANSSSPDPRRAMPWANAEGGFMTKSATLSRVTWSIDSAKSGSMIEKTRIGSFTIEDPSVPVERVNSGWNGGDLVFQYKIPPSYKVQGQEQVVPIRPILVLKANDQTIELPGRLMSTSSGSGLFEFRLNAPEVQGTLDVVGLELTGEMEKSLTFSNFLRVKLLLPQNERVNLESSSRGGDFAFRSIQLWNGQKWVSLRHKSAVVPRGSHIRLIFDSRTELSSLAFQQSFIQSNEIAAELGPLPRMKMSFLNSIDDRLLQVPVERLNQQRMGDKLVVTFQVDQDYVLKETQRLPLDPGLYMMLAQKSGLLLSSGVPAGSGTQSVTTEVLPPRKISGLVASNRNLQKLEVDLPRVTNFERADLAAPPPILRVMPARCERVFTGR